jgi:hypothetical protein
VLQPQALRAVTVADAVTVAMIVWAGAAFATALLSLTEASREK